MLPFVVGVGILDAREVQQHGRDRRLVGRSNTVVRTHMLSVRRLPLSATTSRSVIVALADEQRPAQQADFLIGEQPDRRSA